MWILQQLFKKRNKLNLTSVQCLFSDNNLVKKLNFRSAVQRVDRSNKADLVFDPIGYHEFIWIIQNDLKTFKQLLESQYNPSKQITLDMPKHGFTFRPVSYLLPTDSIVYQALVDKIVERKRLLFSRQVYSHMINPISVKEVFHNQVGHWLEMNTNIRRQNKHGCNFYFFSDVSGYFENIKIRKLLHLLPIYVGREETTLLPVLEKLLETWHFANAQGLIQPHDASSILSKIYLSPIDSHFAYLGKKYNRYVDEFHILSEKKAVLQKYALELSIHLRELGLNQNASKSNFIEGPKILEQFNTDREFFNQVNYLDNIKMDHSEAREVIDSRFIQFIKEFKEKPEDANQKVFRRCVRRFARDKDPLAIDQCIEVLKRDPNQLVTVVRYLAVFIGNEDFSNKIVSFILQYLQDDELNISNWAELWVLGLLSDSHIESHIDLEYIKNIAFDKNRNHLTRSLCFLIIAKFTQPTELIHLIDLYEEEKSIVLKRALLLCISKLPKTYTCRLFKLYDEDSIDIKVLKLYLQNQEYPQDSKVI